MQIKRINIAMLVFLLALPACVTATPIAVSNDNLTIETKSVSNVRIMEIATVQNANDLVIDGKVKRISRYNKRWIPLGHIDAILLDSNGEVIYETTAEFTPRIIPRKTIDRKSKFSLTMPLIAPVGSVLRLSFHRNTHS